MVNMMKKPYRKIRVQSSAYVFAKESSALLSFMKILPQSSGVYILKNDPCGCRHGARKSTYNRNELPKDYSVLTQ